MQRFEPVTFRIKQTQCRRSSLDTNSCKEKYRYSFLTLLQFSIKVFLVGRCSVPLAKILPFKKSLLRKGTMGFMGQQRNIYQY